MREDGVYDHNITMSDAQDEQKEQEREATEKAGGGEPPMQREVSRARLVAPTVKDIIKRFLIRNNFDGLLDDTGDCACENNDLMPCEPNEGILDCRPGYKRPCDCNEEHDFHMATTKSD